MSKLRSLSTAFWSDPFIEELTPNQKLLFIYLITNDKTNMLGIYEVSNRKISFDTGLNKDVIEKALKEFERVKKVKRVGNYIILVNYMKHQNYNTNMKKSAIDVYNSLPNNLKDNELVITKDNPLKGFESLLNHYGMVRKVEVEYEVEVEEETEVEIYPSFIDFWNLYDLKKDRLKCERKWDSLTQTEKEDIINYLPKYIKSTPDKQFRKHPSTFLNNKSWNDEIIIKENKDGQQISEITNRLIEQYPNH